MNVSRLIARLRFRPHSGQALAEMALILPILLLLVFGIIEFGLAWRDYQVITNAAREGARRAVMANAGLVDPSEDAVRGIVSDYMTSGGLDFDPAWVTFSCEGNPGLCGPGMRGAAEEVRIDYPHEFFFFGPLVDVMCVDCTDPGTLTLSTSAVMRSEG